MRVAVSYLLLKAVGVGLLLLPVIYPLFLRALVWLTTGARKRAEEAAYDRIIQLGESGKVEGCGSLNPVWVWLGDWGMCRVFAGVHFVNTPISSLAMHPPYSHTH